MGKFKLVSETEYLTIEIGGILIANEAVMNIRKALVTLTTSEAGCFLSI